MKIKGICFIIVQAYQLRQRDRTSMALGKDTNFVCTEDNSEGGDTDYESHLDIGAFHSQTSTASFTSQTLSDRAFSALSTFALAVDCETPQKLTTEWDTCAPRHQRRHVKQAAELIQAALETLAPGSAGYIWKELVASRSMREWTDSHNHQVDTVLISVVNAYKEAEAPQTKTQLLSLTAQNTSFIELEEQIPGLTKYR